MAHIDFNGRLGKDPELRQSQGGKEYTQLSVAWQERQKDRSGDYHDGPTVWVSVRAFGRQAGNIVASLRKGDHVSVTGRIQPESWSSDRGEETVLTVMADTVAPTLFFQQAQVGKDDQQSGGAPRSGGTQGGWGGQQSRGGFSGGQGMQNDPWNSAPPASSQGGVSGSQPQAGDDTPPF